MSHVSTDFNIMGTFFGKPCRSVEVNVGGMMTILGNIFTSSTQKIILIISLTPGAGPSVMNPALPAANHSREQPVCQNTTNQNPPILMGQVLHWKEDCHISGGHRSNESIIYLIWFSSQKLQFNKGYRASQ